MIFKEHEDGLTVEITDSELTGPVLPFLAMLLRAREIYQRQIYADVDDDNPGEE